MVCIRIDYFNDLLQISKKMKFESTPITPIFNFQQLFTPTLKGEVVENQ